MTGPEGGKIPIYTLDKNVMCSGQRLVSTGKLLVIQLIPAQTLPVPRVYQNQALTVNADTFHMEMMAPVHGNEERKLPHPKKDEAADCGSEGKCTKSLDQ